MNKVLIVLLMLSFAIGFGQKKKTVKKSKTLVQPVKVNTNVGYDTNASYEERKRILESEAPYASAKEESDTPISDYSQIFTAVEINAQPKEGLNEFRKSINASFRLPEVDEDVVATIILRFVVFDDGSLHDIQILKETPNGLGLGNEAIRVFKKSQNWIPGQINGKNVKQYYTFPIRIQIPSSEEVVAPKQEVTVNPQQDGTDYSQIFTDVTVEAEPKDGMAAFGNFLSSNLVLPTVNKTTNAKVVAKFVVLKDGSIKDVQILEETPTNLGLGKEATRVLISSDKWKPGQLKGSIVNQYFTLPITLTLQPTKQ